MYMNVSRALDAARLEIRSLIRQKRDLTRSVAGLQGLLRHCDCQATGGWQIYVNGEAFHLSEREGETESETSGSDEEDKDAEDDDDDGGSDQEVYEFQEMDVDADL